MASESLKRSFDKPVLYSFRRCPYAMRARLALLKAGIDCELREILLKEKPAEMLAVSSKGTVPVLVKTDGSVLDESLDIALWALEQSDPEHWLVGHQDSRVLIDTNDNVFKYWLDRYKYHVGYPEHSQSYYRDRAGEFLVQLENRLSHSEYLTDAKPRLADAMIFPFVRQFAYVDMDWFRASSYRNTLAWLDRWLDDTAFIHCMKKNAPWQASTAGVSFPFVD